VAAREPVSVNQRKDTLVNEDKDVPNSFRRTCGVRKGLNVLEYPGLGKDFTNELGSPVALSPLSSSPLGNTAADIFGSVRIFQKSSGVFPVPPKSFGGNAAGLFKPAGRVFIHLFNGYRVYHLNFIYIHISTVRFYNICGPGVREAACRGAPVEIHAARRVSGANLTGARGAPGRTRAPDTKTRNRGATPDTV
jgi:hypothetical protein